jgi:hypothetical protein
MSEAHLREWRTTRLGSAPRKERRRRQLPARLREPSSIGATCEASRKKYGRSGGGIRIALWAAGKSL